MEHDSLPTAWTFILQAQQAPTQATVRHRCLEHLFVRYREPVKAMIRAWGVHDDATLEDHLQDYFARFLEKNWLDRLDRQRGRFRAFLKTSVRSFLIDHHRRRQRAPGQVPLGPAPDESGEGLQLADTSPSPEASFDRTWARTVLDQALTRLRRDCNTPARRLDWAVFERQVLTDGKPPRYRNTAEELNLSEREVDNRLQRAKKCFAHHTRQLVRETVAASPDIETELSALRTALG